MRASDEQLLIGIHAVTSALKTTASDVTWIKIVADSKNKRLLELDSRAHGSGVKVIRVRSSELDTLAAGQRHQGVVAGFKASNIASESRLDAILDQIDGEPLVLVLDGIQDPHNLGACLRTADAAGVDAVIAPRHGAAGLGPTVSKVAAGAAEHLPFATVANIGRVLDWLSDYGITRVGTSDRADASLFEVSLDGHLALVMGREETGLGKGVAARCDRLVSLPMAGQVSSLNVSVATGICLYEALRQRR